jgi:multidrug efflux pump subunit AcrB
MERKTVAGRIAGAFIQSKLTPIVVIAALILGIFAVLVTPREEEPQIVVPMVDVMVSYPGASAAEVEERITTPMEKLLWEIQGVEYIYSIVKPGQNLTIVRFYVGEDMEDALVRLYTKLMSHYDRIPPGASEPLVRPKSIDDVPILTLTLWDRSQRYSGYELRRLGVGLADELTKDENVSAVSVTGGRRRQVRIDLEPARLAAYHVSALQIAAKLQKANFLIPSGSFPVANREFLVETGGFLEDLEAVAKVVVAVVDGRPVYLGDVAELSDGAEEPAEYVFMGLGPAATSRSQGASTGNEPATAQFEAVTISVAKKKGTNASLVAQRALAKVDALRASLLPTDIEVTVTRNYGVTAKEKSDELLDHMLLATLSVILLIALTLGWRESLVVAVAVPVTLALTLLINYLYGYTLNRVTLFALIFSIGILVDDAIVVVENIHRHFRLHPISSHTAVRAVEEVGNPTILATFTVIAALLPMAFVSGLMGPYMRPIPVGASAAMLFSLLVAFIVSPWLGYRVLKNIKGGQDREQDKLHRAYEKVVAPLIDGRKRRWATLLAVGILLAITLLLLPLKAVTVKMLPFDNKSELQVIIDLPEGATLEETAALAREMGLFLQTVPEVTDFQTYVGTAAPFNFNGLVRHYFLRRASNMADIQVNFVPKHERRVQSHDLAKRLRPELKKLADRFRARVKVAEIPPGPPVQSTLVAEIYGPDMPRRIEIAGRVKKIFEQTAGVVDVDWLVEDDQAKISFVVDRQKAALLGIDTETVARVLRLALGGLSPGLMHYATEKEPVEILLRLPLAERAGLEALQEVAVPAPDGRLISLASLVVMHEGIEDKTIYHKNLKKVTYVTGDVAGAEESPVYAILDMKERINNLQLREGYSLTQYFTVQPWRPDRYAMKWDGEWHITYEVFRDLGIAFAAVLVLIYVLVVAWFGSFLTPLVIMAPIPLTLIGILPGHYIFGAFFTATSMIGFIALAGIIVRNSILLVDFIELEWFEHGDLRAAVLEAGAVRLRPIALTAAAVVVGSFVMLFDPIFQGLAIAMMFGAVAATGLTLIAVPLLYYEFFRNRSCPCRENAAEKQEGIQ